jgi:hypothetical protein
MERPAGPCLPAGPEPSMVRGRQAVPTVGGVGRAGKLAYRQAGPPTAGREE